MLSESHSIVVLETPCWVVHILFNANTAHFDPYLLYQIENRDHRLLSYTNLTPCKHIFKWSHR